MKKAILLLALLALPGGMSLRGAGEPLPVKAAEGEPVKSIPWTNENFSSEEWADQVSYDEEGDITLDRRTAEGWRDVSWGTFWEGRHFNALDSFYRGEWNEGWTGTIRSIDWVQDESCPYVTFTLGGNVNEGSYLAIVDAEGNNATTDPDGKIVNDYFADPALSNNMIVRVVEIAESFYGKPLHLEIHDVKTGGFGMINFGALSPNQTAEEVSDTLWEHGFGGQGATVTTETNSDLAAQEYIWGKYTDPANAEYAPFMEDAREVTATSVEEDFESGELSSLWTVDLNYAENPDGTLYYDFDRTKAVSDISTISWAEKTPFNKDGNYFLNSWNDQGGAAHEGPRWRLLSKPFVLTGTGIVTAKMGGHNARLSLYAYDGDKPLPDETPLASMTHEEKGWTDNLDCTLGGNNVTMRRSYLDASEHVGKTVVLALEDFRATGIWGHAFFDSISTSVELSELSSFPLEIIEQKQDGWAAPRQFAVRSAFFGKSVEESSEDIAPIAEASLFLDKYFATARPAGNPTYCALPKEDALPLQKAYEALSPEAKSIVDLSGDYSYEGYEETGTIDLTRPVEETTVGKSMENLIERIAGETPSPSAFRPFGGEPAESAPWLVLLLLLLAISSVSAFILYKRRKASK